MKWCFPIIPCSFIECLSCIPCSTTVPSYLRLYTVYWLFLLHSMHVSWVLFVLYSLGISSDIPRYSRYRYPEYRYLPDTGCNIHDPPWHMPLSKDVHRASPRPMSPWTEKFYLYLFEIYINFEYLFTEFSFLNLGTNLTPCLLIQVINEGQEIYVSGWSKLVIFSFLSWSVACIFEGVRKIYGFAFELVSPIWMVVPQIY